MVKIKFRHLLFKKSGYYYHPSAWMRRSGFLPEALGKDLAAAVERAEQLNAEWDAMRA